MIGSWVRCAVLTGVACTALSGAVPMGAQGYYLRSNEAEQIVTRRAAELTARLAKDGAYDYSLDGCNRVSGRRIECTASVFFENQTCRQLFDIRYASPRSRRTVVGTRGLRCLGSRLWLGDVRSPRRPTPIVLFGVAGDRLEQFYLSRLDVPCSYGQDEPMGIARKGKFKAIPIVGASVTVHDAGPGWEVSMQGALAGNRWFGTIRFRAKTLSVGVPDPQGTRICDSGDMSWSALLRR
jgi:hypothetical protein